MKICTLIERNSSLTKQREKKKSCIRQLRKTKEECKRIMKLLQTLFSFINKKNNQKKRKLNKDFTESMQSNTYTIIFRMVVIIKWIRSFVLTNESARYNIETIFCFTHDKSTLWNLTDCVTSLLFGLF